MYKNSDLLLQSITDVLFMLDMHGCIQYVNAAATRVTGFTEAELLNKPFSIFYYNDNVKAEHELGLARTDGRLVSEGWRSKKNGEHFWGEITLSLLADKGEAIGFSCLLRDTTEKKQREIELRESEERNRLMVEAVKDYAIFRLDPQGYIVSWNEGAKRIKGYSANEIIGKHFSTFYTQEDLDDKKPERELKIAVATGQYEEEGWRVKKDGSLFWANVLITAVYNKEGVHIGFSKVTRDLTERKEAERALRESYERYRMLADELKEINNELTYANQELEQFTSIVSHDLQEPIRTIKSFLQLIELKINEGQTDNLKTYINKSINAASRMRELIQNLLHYSQLSKGEIEVEKIDVNEIIAQALQNMKTAVDASHAQVSIETEVDHVYGDRVQLVQLIQNLLSNALKFTTSDNPKVCIRCYREKNGNVRFSVSDNGIGIAKSDMDKVFEIFRRLDTAKDYPGTGIGLAICKKIVDRHGGRIWPESEPGKGTTFYFTLNQQVKEGVVAA